MAKIKYSAKLANGHVVTRNSDRAYTHFWRAHGRGEFKGYSGGDSGFSGSLELAMKAVASTISRIRKQGGADVQITSEIVEARVEEPGCDLEFRSKNQAVAWSCPPQAA